MSGVTTFYGVTYPSSTDYVKDGATAIQTVATGFDSAVAIPTYNAQTGATYTFVLADTGKTVTASNASAQTYTIPPTASVAWTANTTLRVLNLGAGVVTFAAGAGVTVTNTAQTLAQYQSARLVRTGLDAWTVTPDSGQTQGGLTLLSTTTVGTTVSTVTVSGAFSSAYENYKITFNGGSASASDQNVLMVLGSTTTGYYSIRSGYRYAASAFDFVDANNGSAWSPGAYVGTNPTLNMDVLQPNLAGITLFNGSVNAGAGIAFSAGYQSASTQFTAFTLSNSSGTFTGGKIRVYGYTN